MFKDLFLAIAAGVLGTIPVSPPPAVIVTTSDIESSVVQYVQNHENRTVDVDCSEVGPKISVEEGKTQNLTCVTTDVENKEIFNTKIALSSTNGKVDISAVLDKSSSESSTGVTSPEKK